MNAITQYILGIYQLNMIVRDTIGYLVPRGENKYDKGTFEHRRRSLALLTGEGSPFAHFLSINQDKAEKLQSNIDDFINEIYGNDATIIRIVGENVEVDDGQHIRVYEMAVGIYQTLLDILNGYLKYAREQKQEDHRVEEVIAADEYYFRALSHYAMINDLFKLFREFSDAMRAHNGDQNPVAKFINDDITKIANLIAFEDKYNKVKHASYNKMVDLSKAFLESMSGKRALPEGRNFPDLFKELNEFSLKTLQEAEGAWRTSFMPIAKEYQESIKNKAERKDPEGLA